MKIPNIICDLMEVVSYIPKSIKWLILGASIVGLTTVVSKGAEVVSQQADAVIAIAEKVANSHYKEGSDNDTSFGRWYGLPNQPWCAMFVSWCFSRAGLQDLVTAQSDKGFAYCPTGLKWFADRNQLVPLSNARRGDIIFFRFNGAKRANHVGILYKHVPEKGYMLVYEGNTSSPDDRGSDREGDGVYLKKRYYDPNNGFSPIIGVARPGYTNTKSVKK